MNEAPLPKAPKGDWIWHPDSLQAVDSYVFFRREFTLAEVPTVAELWVAVGSACQIFVNGRHVAQGPAGTQRPFVACASYDVGYCLQVGHNVLAVLAHNARVARTGGCQQPSGLWCQLEIDGAAAVTSDSSWQVLDGRQCYQGHQPRVSRGDAFVESVDLRRYPFHWQELNFEPSASWGPAKVLATVGHWPLALKGQPHLDLGSEHYDFVNLVLKGTATQANVFTHVAFPRGPENPPGVYAAETFVQVPEAQTDLPFLLLTDDPYLLLINDVQVKSQGWREFKNHEDPTWQAPRGYQQEGLTEPAGGLNLQAGWNRIVLVQQVGENAAGASLILPETDARAVKFLRGSNSFSLPGWNLMGPLLTPFGALRNSLSLEGLARSAFYGSGPNDVAAWHRALAFNATEEAYMPVDSIELQPNEFVVLELDRFVRGCPELDFSGQDGDEVDLVFGDYISGTRVPALEHGIRQLYTVTLGQGILHWQAFAPHGFKYLMILARQTKGPVQCHNLGVRRMVATFREPAVFQCSDELLNQIWEVGASTLLNTYDGNFLDNASSACRQVLGDAMIQAIASLFVTGDPALSEKGLRDFAAAQFETGEMPTVVPSDYHSRHLDLSLLWPIWLQKHILHSGSQQLLKDMLPHLESLLVYMESLANKENLLLGNDQPPYDFPVLLDHDQALDRKGFTTGLNALYVNALLKSEWLFNEAGHPEEAAVCRERASAVARQVRHLCWDEEKGLFADGWYNGGRSPSYSMQANVLALYSGLARENQYTTIFDNMLLEYAPYHKMSVDQATETPYFKFFLLDVTFSLNLRDWAADFIRYYWGKMLSQGASTWWRHFCPDIDFNPAQARNLCQGYGVSPNIYLITEVLGVRPANPGFSKIYFNPLLSAVEWARAQIPTPRGMIQVHWSFNDDGELEIIIEASFPLEVVALIDPAIASGATLRVSDEVTILSSK